MLLLSVDLRFDPSTCLTPLVHQLASFFHCSLLLQLAILLLPPDRLQFLLEKLICWIIAEVAGTAFKSVLILEFDLLGWFSALIHSVETGEWQVFDSLFGLIESLLLIG